MCMCGVHVCAHVCTCACHIASLEVEGHLWMYTFMFHLVPERVSLLIFIHLSQASWSLALPSLHRHAVTTVACAMSLALHEIWRSPAVRLAQWGLHPPIHFPSSGSFCILIWLHKLQKTAQFSGAQLPARKIQITAPFDFWQLRKKKWILREG